MKRPGLEKAQGVFVFVESVLSALDFLRNDLLDK
jgi:hypothetical protein